MVGAGPRGMLLVLVALLALDGGVSAQDTPAQPTFEFAPKEGKPGRVLAVSGTGCTIDGRALEYASVRLARNVVEGGGEPFDSSTRYPVGADGSWSGEFVVPVEAAPGPHTLSSACGASDFLVEGVDTTFAVLDLPPAAVAVTQSTARAGDRLTASVASCVFENGAAAASALFSLRDAAHSVVATADAPIDSAGSANVAMQVPDPVARSGTARVDARCESDQGSLVARSAALTIGAAVAVQPPKVTLTG